MSGITTHVLDTAQGRPARGVPVRLDAWTGTAWKELGRGETDADGRKRDLLPAGTAITAGRYRMFFDTGAYFAAAGTTSFYPEAAIVFEIHDPTQHFHVPLLLAPYGYSTYRGS
ncbi:MAG: hydroxyisourate hydrolase [Polyangiaceae bacterium]